MLEYKGYIGSVAFDNDAGLFHGDIVNTRDVITFQGESVSELRQAFQDSVEDYLEFCTELGREPEKPMSGKFNVRISPQLHAYAAATARSGGVSLNTLVESAIEQYVGSVASSASLPAEDGLSTQPERRAPTLPRGPEECVVMEHSFSLEIAAPEAVSLHPNITVSMTEMTQEAYGFH